MFHICRIPASALLITLLVSFPSCRSAGKKTAPPAETAAVRIVQVPAANNSKPLGRAAAMLLSRQTPSLAKFHRALFDDQAHSEKEILSYLLHEYPIIVPGNKGKMIHHHPFAVRDESKQGELVGKLFKETEDSDSYLLSFDSFRYYETLGYDNVRYAWWNPYVENYNDPRWFPDLADDYFGKAPQTDAAKVLLVSCFKTTFERSPRKISALYKRFRDVFFESVDEKLYTALKMDVTVDTLLEGYDFFRQGKKREFEEMITKRLFGGCDDPFLPAVSAYNCSWYYTFWQRRESEHNADTVASILKEVQLHYAQRAESAGKELFDGK